MMKNQNYVIYQNYQNYVTDSFVLYMKTDNILSNIKNTTKI